MRCRVAGTRVVFWQLGLLLLEFMAGLLAQKSAEGYYKQDAHRPCSGMAKNHMQMLDRLKGDLQHLVNEIDTVQQQIRQATAGLASPGQHVARS